MNEFFTDFITVLAKAKHRFRKILDLLCSSFKAIHYNLLPLFVRILAIQISKILNFRGQTQQ